MKDRIITAQDYSPDNTVIGYWVKQQKGLHKGRGIAVPIVDIDKKATGKPVKARVWQGQWIAECECKSASFVSPEDPRFFCFGCGNYQNGKKPRPVEFPEDYTEIERLLLDRPVEVTTGLTELERTALAKPSIFVEGKGGLGRDWNPGETVADLREQNKPIKKWRKKAGK